MGRGRPGSGGGRGRGRGGGGFRGGGAGRGRGGNSNSGSSRSRGRGRGGNKPSFSKKEITHYHQFGEQHPSEEVSDFGPSSSKQPKLENDSRGRGGFRGRGRGRGGRGRGGFNNDNKKSKNNEDNSASSDESEEEITPYKELLTLFAKNKGTSYDEVQIVSESEEEDDEDEDLESHDEIEENGQVPDEKEDNESGAEGEDSVSGGDDDDLVDEQDDLKPDVSGSDDEKIENSSKSKLKTKSKKSASKGSIKEGQENSKNGIHENPSLLDEDDDVLAPVEETVIEEAEIDPEMEEALVVDDTSETIDPFLLHYEREMSELLQTHLKAEKPEKVQVPCVWPVIDRFNHTRLNIDEANEKDTQELTLGTGLSLLERSQPVRVPDSPLNPPKTFDLESFCIKAQFLPTLPITNQAIIDKESCKSFLNPFQTEILSLASQYYDVYYPMRSLENAEALRNVYCLHAANHILKTRTRILHHNAKMANKVDVPDAYRDQGFVRAKVLILVPFKDSAFRIIKTLISLFLVEEKGNVVNKKRFIEEYSGATLFLPKTNPKPDDYNATFDGNVEDNFKIGLSLTKKTVKLYTGFYSADIIIASPLGLRLIVGAEGERDRDYDFLSSIELVIMDQADVFLMQNWDHVLHLMRHLHLQPVTTHGTDFARIRPWALDGLTKYFSQTLVFSAISCPEHSSLMSRYCHNYAGIIRVQNALAKGSICQVTVQLPQVFQFFECASLQEQDDVRFDFFIKKVLPTFTDKLMSHTLIFVSSYFDFVRLRNHFKREQTGFVQICEYTKDKKVARARDYFFHGQSHFLLYTERVHFFRRFRLKGIGHIIFYQLPQYPHFYSELCNTIREDFQNRRVRQRKNSSVNVIYCKYDTPRLAAIVGSDRASHMLSSEKTVHAFVSGEL